MNVGDLGDRERERERVLTVNVNLGGAKGSVGVGEGERRSTGGSECNLRVSSSQWQRALCFRPRVSLHSLQQYRSPPFGILPQPGV